MRRRFANREEWRRLLERRFEVERVERPGFSGYVSWLSISSVTEPLVVSLDGRQYRLADAGFTWLQHVPDDTRHTLTTLLDEQRQVIQWYVDIAARTGVDERGIPYWDDLYLDVVILRDGSVHLLDEDELEEALAAGEISREDYELARAEAGDVTAAVHEGRFSLLAESKRDLCNRRRSGT
jgi:predicted RNA-binding protein associated with RNAse of E/G family